MCVARARVCHSAYRTSLVRMLACRRRRRDRLGVRRSDRRGRRMRDEAVIGRRVGLRGGRRLQLSVQLSVQLGLQLRRGDLRGGVPGGPGHSTTTALPGVPGGPGHSTTALPGVPGGRGHSTTPLPGVPGGRGHSTTALPKEYLEYLEFLLRKAQNHLLPQLINRTSGETYGRARLAGWQGACLQNICSRFCFDGAPPKQGGVSLA